MYILGVSSYYHDSSVALIKDGVVLCAYEEERFTRVKHDNSFPYKSMERCLKDFNLKISDISAIAYYEKPLLKFERILEMFIDTYPASLKSFLISIPEWLSEKIKVENTIRNKIGFKGKIYYIPHHLSHASATYLTSSFSNSSILTIDGVGEYNTTVLWKANGLKIEQLGQINIPHSVGLLYSTFTAFLGFRVNNDEYKMMGLAAYGKPLYVKKILKLIDVKDDGSFRLNTEFFSFGDENRMWNTNFEKIFGRPRVYGSKISKRDMDLAASIQTVTEDIYMKMLNYLYKLNKTKNLCISGGVALNSLANGKIFYKTPFKCIHNFGAAGDDGAAIGCALYVCNVLKKSIRHNLNSLSLGNEYKDFEIEAALKCANLKYKKTADQNKLVDFCAKKLSEDKIVGWFQGRMEFGPRALGNRSILANPNHRNMKSFVNKIKRREKFRPFAGSVLEEFVHDLFEIPAEQSDFGFMNFCFKVKHEERNKLNAIVHKDGTCRIQTVNKDNGIYYKLISKFYKLSGVPCILNTSYNVDGEPIVENPEQAIKDFLSNPIDYLVIGNFIVSK